MEAMACGLPYVATNVGGVREVIPDDSYGRVVAAGPPDAMAGGDARSCSVDEDLRVAIGKRARQRVLEEFEYRSLHAATQSVLAQVVP